MTPFGRILVFIFLALIGGTATLVVKNFPVPPRIAPIGHSDTLQNVGTSTTTPTFPETATTTTPVSAPLPVPEETPVSAIVPALPIPPAVSIVEPNWEKINNNTRAALANILCTAKYGDQFKPLSGTGVFIDPRGVILTNAHVAQYLLLTGGTEKSNLLDCVIRVGNPAENRYRAEVLFISPHWVEENAKNLLDENPKERGDYDYALLLVTSTTNSGITLPNFFPFLPLREELLNPDTEDAFLAAGYPAGFLGGIATQRALWSVASFATITSRYTFTENTLDLVGLGGNLLAQKGSSGGALVDYKGDLAGLIVTATLEGATDVRDVRALTTDYINRTFSAEASFPLYELKNIELAPLLSQFTHDFLPPLRKLLTDVLEKN